MLDLREVVKSIGVERAADACGVSPRAVYKWLDRRRLPRTEYSGETRYAEILAELSEGQFDAQQLLENLKTRSTAA